PALGAAPPPLDPEDPPVGHRRDVPLEDVQVGPADRGRVHLHDHISRVDELRVGSLLPGFLTRAVVPWLVCWSTCTMRSGGSMSSGSGASSQAFCPGPWYTSAFIS